MKWTADNDQLLFTKLIETHNITIKAEKIREAWPKGGEIPTARAISERIVRIRNSSKISGGATSTPSTPRKRKSTDPMTSTRKLQNTENDSKSESPTKRIKKLKTVVKEELDDY